MKNFLCLAVTLFTLVASRAQVSNVTMVFDYAVSSADVEVIRDQMPRFKKLLKKGKVTLDIAKTPIADNQIVRYQDEYFSLPSSYQAVVKCGLESCEEISKFMIYKPSSTRLIVLNQSNQKCDFRVASTQVVSLLDLDKLLHDLLGSKKGRMSNRELVVFISKNEIRQKPELFITSDDFEVEEIKVYPGESVRLNASCTEQNAKLVWRPIKSSAPSISFTPKETAYYSVEARIAQCDPIKDSVLVTVVTCTSNEKPIADFRNSKLFSVHPTNNKIHWLYRSDSDDIRNYVFVTSTSCKYKAYKIIVRNMDRNVIVFDKIYSISEVKESSSLNSVGGIFEGKFVFNLRDGNLKIDEMSATDFNYDNTFEIKLVGITLSDNDEELLTEIAQFSACP